MHEQPPPILAAERRKRIRRITALSSELGFVGNVEYRHVYSQSGGAQYCIGPSANDDIMVLYAEAFERDADPDDFNLDALIAHECGHQRLHRDPKFGPLMTRFSDDVMEEILASLVGSLLLGDSDSSESLVWKAAMELGNLRVSPEFTSAFVGRLLKDLRLYL